METTPKIDPSGKVYTPLSLRLYDFIVLVFSNNWMWRCPTKSVLLPTYTRHFASAEHHLDIGVGTGYYPAHAVTKTTPKSITLMDINSSTLVVAEQRIKANGYKGRVDVVNHSVFDPLSEDSELRGKFDSIAMYYLLHCLPGQFPSKAEIVARNMADGLTKDGVIHGATILARAGSGHNWLGRFMMNFYNKKQIFGNREDDEDGLRKGLEAVFKEVTIEVVGMVAIFVCRYPRV
jgi:tRNA G37 N-methylase Trm5